VENAIRHAPEDGEDIFVGTAPRPQEGIVREKGWLLAFGL
jgi:hypothetical protein